MIDKPPSLQLPERAGKRIRIALPIRVTYWDAQSRPRLQMGCTYDISAQGARITGLPCIKAEGEIIAVERGRSRVYCRVAWIGEDDSELRGQVGLQCIEHDKQMWEAELRELQEVYEPVPANLPGSLRLDTDSQVRRRAPRFPIGGFAELIRLNRETQPGLEALLKNLGQNGCLVGAQSTLVPGTNLRMVLNIGNYDFTVKGEVRHAARNGVLGIEFREIRKGDRPVLQYILRKLAEHAQDMDITEEAHAATACP